MYPEAPIYGGSGKVAAVTKLVKDKDEFEIGDNVHVKYISIPFVRVSSPFIQFPFADV